MNVIKASDAYMLPLTDSDEVFESKNDFIEEISTVEPYVDVLPISYEKQLIEYCKTITHKWYIKRNDSEYVVIEPSLIEKDDELKYFIGTVAKKIQKANN